MLTINFLDVEFAKPHRYFLLLKSQGQSKRTQISESTESPCFDPVTVQGGDIQLSVCLVLDYSPSGLTNKTLVLGTTVIEAKQYAKQVSRTGACELHKSIVQSKQGKQLVVGTIRLKVLRQLQTVEADYLDQIEGLEFKEESEDNPGNSSDHARKVKITVLLGSHFPANESFRVQAGWCDSYSSMNIKKTSTTILACASIFPIWNQEMCFLLDPLDSGYATLILKDSNQSIVDKISIPIAKLQPFRQYHLDVRLRQTLQGTQPHLFFQIQLEALPKAFIQEVCQVNISKLFLDPEVDPHRRFFLTYSQQQIGELNFTSLFLNQKVPVEIEAIQRINREDFNPYFLSPILTTPFCAGFQYFFLKSLFIRKRLYCTLFQLGKQTLFKTRKVAVNDKCITQLKQCFYEQKTSLFSLDWKEGLSKTTLTIQISPVKVYLHSSQQKPFQPERENDLMVRWRDLSNELLLKQRLTRNIGQEIDTKMINIQDKGRKIQVLRRVERQLIERKKFLAYKSAQESCIKAHDTEGDVKVDMGRLKKQLIEVCEQALAVESINEQMRLRLDSLDIESKQTDIKSLETRAVTNSRILQEQQEKIQEIGKIDELLMVQAKTLLKLQSQFEKGIIDHQMNQLLEKELKRPKSIPQNDPAFTMTQDEHNLTRILSLLAQEDKSKPEGQTAILRKQIQEAQLQLTKKTQAYAKMMSK